MTYKGTTGAYGCASSSTPSQAYANPNNVDLKTIAPGISSALYTLLTTPSRRAAGPELPAARCRRRACCGGAADLRLGHFLRPCMVEFIGCTNVADGGLSHAEHAVLAAHPTDCTNVVIRGVMVDSIGPNNDGFDPDACNNVLCDGMVFNTGDDCIASSRARISTPNTARRRTTWCRTAR
ncbi:glycosyl hydrolase family 28 protein [Burkholderia plantarii]|uniref:glycosyl hydrolase family 28 protein n=1 Tax=Burkholderia plantarii TaxID=41899 RepID=UPI001F5C036E|nr:glycosyl hydrolase family 28 protein [Burkholderia plantarii]